MDGESKNRLLKLLRLTTSPHDGEALAAIRKANEMLSSRKLEWASLILPTAPPPKQKSSARDDVIEQMFDFLESARLSESSREFVESLRDYWDRLGDLTEKQHAALTKTYNFARRARQ